MNIINSSGLRLELWGTPDETIYMSQTYCREQTAVDRKDMKQKINFIRIKTLTS